MDIRTIFDILDSEYEFDFNINTNGSFSVRFRSINKVPDEFRFSSENKSLLFCYPLPNNSKTYIFFGQKHKINNLATEISNYLQYKYNIMVGFYELSEYDIA